MTRLLAPLLSIKAWGTIAREITFRRRKALTDALKKPIPEDAKTAIQLAQRLLFRDAVAFWHALSEIEKQAYDKPGREHHMSGYAWFIRSYLLNPPAATFISLTDTPGAYVGEAGHPPIVNAGETALEWGTIKEFPSGIVSIPGQSAAKAYLAILQFIPHNIYTRVNLDFTIFDIQNEFAPKRFTADEDGIYTISAAATWTGWAGNNVWRCTIYKNGVLTAESTVQTSFNNLLSHFISDIKELDAGDFVELYVRQFTGAPQILLSGQHNVFLAIAKTA